MTDEEKWALFEEFRTFAQLRAQYDALVSQGPAKDKAGAKPKVTFDQWRVSSNKTVW